VVRRGPRPGSTDLTQDSGQSDVHGKRIDSTVRAIGRKLDIDLNRSFFDWADLGLRAPGRDPKRREAWLMSDAALNPAPGGVMIPWPRFVLGAWKWVPSRCKTCRRPGRRIMASSRDSADRSGVRWSLTAHVRANLTTDDPAIASILCRYSRGTPSHRRRRLSRSYPVDAACRPPGLRRSRTVQGCRLRGIDDGRQDPPQGQPAAPSSR